tara:strand:+ start:1072 stop:1320 length:249 start_codon:yes stop_codon:yes gene_type:complete
MSYIKHKYIIINASEVSSIDFSQVCETSADHLRYSLDGSQTFVKFDGDTPSFLSGKEVFDHNTMSSFLSSPWWKEIDEDIPE